MVHPLFCDNAMYAENGVTGQELFLEDVVNFSPFAYVFQWKRSKVIATTWQQPDNYDVPAKNPR